MTLELEYRSVLKAAIKVWGSESQIDMLHEEIGELLQAVNKNKRKSSHETRDNLLEEIADVEIMLEQLKLIIGGNPHAGIYAHKQNKLERLKERIEAKNQFKPCGEGDLICKCTKAEECGYA